ncbi:MAG: IclR family transcriptional regulator [Solirubrobacterales bacterium]|nr:IclR family transcriptional regulator [Solirubrobacterales bacterium]
METPDHNAPGGHRAAKRALELIEHIASAEAPVTLSELARQVDLPKSSAHALTRTLADEGYLARDHRGAFALGPRLLRLLGRLPQRFELPRVARPTMQRLVDDLGETAILGVRQGPSVVYIEQIEAPQMIRYVAPLGEPRPLHATSIGKVFLASMSPADADEILQQQKLERFTQHTVTSRRAILADLSSIRDHGYAVNREESMPGIAAIAVPVHAGGTADGEVIAGLSMTGVSARMVGDLTAQAPRLVAAAAEIGAAVQRR